MNYRSLGSLRRLNDAQKAWLPAFREKTILLSRVAMSNGPSACYESW